MKKTLCFFCWMIASVCLAQESVPFVYNENDKKDPFEAIVSSTGVLASSDAEVIPVDIVLEGVVADPKNNNLAIINGKIVKVGDVVSTYTVEAISVDQVDLSKGQERLTVKIKKGDS